MTAMVALQLAGTALSVVGAMREGAAAEQAGNYNAALMRAKAGENRASSQRAAIEERRQASIRQSNAIAAAGASGAGASDITVVKTVSDLAGHGEYEALTRLYEGESAARGNESQANMAQWEGKQKKSAAKTKALTAAVKGGGTLFDKYGSDLFDSGSSKTSLPWLSDGSAHNPYTESTTPWVYN